MVLLMNAVTDLYFKSDWLLRIAKEPRCRNKSFGRTVSRRHEHRRPACFAIELLGLL